MIKLDENVTSKMNEYLEGDTIEAILLRNKKIFHYSVMLTPAQMNQDIDVLDLSQRAHNCLRRYGFNTVGKLINGVHTREDETSKKQLLKVHSLGKNTAEEILIKLFYYQFLVLPEGRRKEYMQEVAETNL
ncbi:MAG: hypothetical protein K6C35_02300 [Eubacterium sp.]|nr:hypothetical protein [Eubacterium sp.]SEF57178.1 RNA polymerase, alpha chain C terminal domain [Eubacterium ruminantium]